MTTTTNSQTVETPRQRLAAKMRPALLALGKVASTETGKALFALAYDADVSMDIYRERDQQSEGKRATRAHEDARYFYGLSRGERATYARTLAMMMNEASGFSAGFHLCMRIVNAEIDAMRQRTDEQRQSAPITALFPMAVDLF